MSIYFDFKTINELTGDNYYRKQKEFILDELEQYDWKNGNPAYVAMEGIVYDVNNEPNLESGIHYGINTGRDLSDQFSSCHGMMDVFSNTPKVDVLSDDDLDNMNDNSNMSMNRCFRQNQDTSKFTPDDWIRYITPLVTYGLREPNQGMSPQSIYQKIILLGVLVGLGRTPQEAINQVQEWQNTGASKLLKGGASMGTGTTGTTGTGGGLGTGGTGIGAGAGTGGGFGTGGTGMGAGAGTGGGFGTGGTGMGTGAGTGGGFGTGGTGMGTGAGTGGGFGTGGTGMGAGAGTGGGFGTGGTGIGTGAGTSGGTGAGTTGGIGTAGTTRKRESGNRDRLYFD
ncbi:cytochrome b5 [Clostridium chromiireducens]|uniref:Cytochrome b5 n=1 Tax=Clostridium chromiireducens TaxID=225345 RepID=A0A964RM91_9CLOT|nr:cytochrome b5 [Clostridium chromiireducens]MVX64424.1 cytochrome b5 [Clostridium chromiireducens]